MRFRLYEENALNDPDVQDTLEELPEEEADIVEEILNKVNFDPIDNPNDITDALDSALDTAIESLEFGEATSGAAANILLVGGAGTGKTSIVKDWAKARGINLVPKNASSFDKTDMGGGVAREVDENGVGTNAMTRLTNKEFDSLQKAGSVLFLDELNRADPEVVGSLLTLILDHQIPDNYSEGGIKFLKGYLFTVAAINPSADDALYSTGDFDNALLDRFRQIAVYANVPQYRKYLLKKLNDELKEAENNLKKRPRLAKRYENQILKQKRKIALADTVLSSPLFEFDGIDDEKEMAQHREDNPMLQGKILSPRGFSGLIKACDGTKEDFLRKWPQFCNYKKQGIIEEILEDYVDIEDKANDALKYQYDDRGNPLGNEEEEPEAEDFFSKIEMDI